MTMWSMLPLVRGTRRSCRTRRPSMPARASASFRSPTAPRSQARMEWGSFVIARRTPPRTLPNLPFTRSSRAARSRTYLRWADEPATPESMGSVLPEAGIDPVRLSVVEQDADRPPVARRAGRLPVVDPLLARGIPPIAGVAGSAESRRSGSCTAGRALLRGRQPLRRCRRRHDRAVGLLELELRRHRAARLELAALQTDLVRRVVDRLQETVKSVDDSERIRESGRVAGEVDSVSGVCVRSHAVGEPARELPAARRGQA